MKDNIKLSITVPVEPKVVYNSWFDSKEHSAFTRSNVDIQKKVGSSFTSLDGYVTGEVKQMIMSKQIVMSWRSSDFLASDEDSLLTVSFEGQGSSTKVVILHENLPEGEGKKYRKSWKDNYFVHMKDYFSL